MTSGTSSSALMLSSASAADVAMATSPPHFSTRLASPSALDKSFSIRRDPRSLHASIDGLGKCRFSARSRLLGRGGARHRDAKHRASPQSRFQMYLMTERGCETPNDRQTKTDPRVSANTGFPALKFHEDGLALGFRNTR